MILRVLSKDSAVAGKLALASFASVNLVFRVVYATIANRFSGICNSQILWDVMVSMRLYNMRKNIKIWTDN